MRVSVNLPKPPQVLTVAQLEAGKLYVVVEPATARGSVVVAGEPLSDGGEPIALILWSQDITDIGVTIRHRSYRYTPCVGITLTLESEQ